MDAHPQVPDNNGCRRVRVSHPIRRLLWLSFFAANSERPPPCQSVDCDTCHRQRTCKGMLYWQSWILTVQDTLEFVEIDSLPLSYSVTFAEDYPSSLIPSSSSLNITNDTPIACSTVKPSLKLSKARTILLTSTKLSYLQRCIEVPSSSFLEETPSMLPSFGVEGAQVTLCRDYFDIISSYSSTTSPITSYSSQERNSSLPAKPTPPPCIFEQLYSQLHTSPPEIFKRPWFVRFRGENAVDAGGAFQGKFPI